MNEEKDLLKLFIEGGWLVSVMGAAGMLARLITSPLKRADWLDYIKKIIVATITTTMAWFLIEQVELSSITKAITYGVIGVVTGRKLDFQGDRVREGFKGRVPAGNGVGPL